ncbi:MAG: homocysteine S-methyltransferase family protein [Flavobacteriaceae bacterium]
MIEAILKERILVLDGAMGTMIQRLDLTEEQFRAERFKNHPCPLGGNNDLLSITQADVIKNIHEQYLLSGADIIETNTFSSNSIAMTDYQLEGLAYELNFESAKIAKEVTQKISAKNPDKPRFVAGSIGPTNKTASMSPDVNDPGFRAVSFDQLFEAYREQVAGLVEGGVDLLLVETVFDTLNAKAALFAIQDYFHEKKINLSIMVSGTITDNSGRTLSGQTVEAFAISISHLPILSIGFNCALGASQLLPYIKRLSKITPFYTSVHPNAGLPNAFGEYDQSPQEMATLIEQFLNQNLVNIVGGCCGTTPDHIRLIADAASNAKPRISQIMTDV